MEWVETTGRTIEEAKDAALDQLGVDEQDAEFEILEEARSGLFGRLRQEARVRARVQPTTPRPKVDRRRRKPAKSGDADAPESEARTAPDDDTTADATADITADTIADTTAEDAPPPSRERAPRGKPRTRREPAAATKKQDSEPRAGATTMDERDLETQAETVRSFLEGLVEAFDVEGSVTVETVDEDTLEAQVDGDDLGLLIGPKGQTLVAVQELARAMLQRQGPGGARLRVDVGGYRERRREALARFTRTVAEQVLSSGTATSLEPMSAADRKVVHDTANEIDGVHTTSEGEDPRRRVVIHPDAD